MSMFLPEGSGQKQDGVSSITPANPETTSDDIAVMQRAFAAAARNPNLIPDDFMAYLLDYVQTSRLQIPIGQVFGYQRIATQVITDFAQVPSPVDGQVIMLKTGASAPFTYTPMVYDQQGQHWASPEFSLGGGSVQGVSAQTPSAPSGAISWSPVHLGGCTLQLKWAGFGRTTDVTKTTHGGIYLYFVNIGSSFATATMSDSTSAALSDTQMGVDWTNVTDPGAFSLVLGAIYASCTAPGLGSVQGAITGRFIK